MIVGVRAISRGTAIGWEEVDCNIQWMQDRCVRCRIRTGRRAGRRSQGIRTVLTRQIAMHRNRIARPVDDSDDYLWPNSKTLQRCRPNKLAKESPHQNTIDPGNRAQCGRKPVRADTQILVTRNSKRDSRSSAKRVPSSWHSHTQSIITICFLCGL
jgi:hypothetical protein